MEGFLGGKKKKERRRPTERGEDATGEKRDKGERADAGGGRGGEASRTRGGAVVVTERDGRPPSSIRRATRYARSRTADSSVGGGGIENKSSLQPPREPLRVVSRLRSARPPSGAPSPRRNRTDVASSIRRAQGLGGDTSLLCAAFTGTRPFAPDPRRGSPRRAVAESAATGGRRRAGGRKGRRGFSALARRAGECPRERRGFTSESPTPSRLARGPSHRGVYFFRKNQTLRAPTCRQPWRA